MQQITITDFTGTTPADLWVCSEISGATCSSGSTGCYFVGTTSVFPYTFYVSGDTLDNNFFIKIIDGSGCVTCKTVFILETPTPTPTIPLTPTPTTTMSITPTPTETPSLYYAYVIPEPQDAVSQAELGSYMLSQGSQYFFGFGNSGLPNLNNYATEMDIYMSFSGFSGGGTKFKTDVSTLKSVVRTTAGYGYDTFNCIQQQYTFGTIKVDVTDIDPTETYFYSIWIPDSAIPSWVNMSVNIGLQGSCSKGFLSDTIPSPTLSSIPVTVGLNGKIPSGTYRVLWMPFSGLIPNKLPSVSYTHLRAHET